MMRTIAKSGRTSKTVRPRGAGHPVPGLVLPLLEFDLPAEERLLHKEDAWNVISRNAKTLAKYDDMRVVLIAMKAGTRTDGHQTHGSLAILCLAGKLTVHLANTNVEVPAGRLLTLERNLPHDVEALEDSTFLLTLSWPREQMESAEVNMAA